MVLEQKPFSVNDECCDAVAGNSSAIATIASAFSGVNKGLDLTVRNLRVSDDQEITGNLTVDGISNFNDKARCNSQLIVQDLSTFNGRIVSKFDTAGSFAFQARGDVDLSGDVSVANLVFPDGTTQATASGETAFVSTSGTPTYDSDTQLTTYNFTAHPTYDAFTWYFYTPVSSRSTVTIRQLDASKPLYVGPVTSNDTFVYMNGIGVAVPYLAYAATQITYCQGFQESYTLSQSSTGLQMTGTSMVGGSLDSIQYISDNIKEDDTTCPPSTKGSLDGSISIKLQGDTTSLGPATLRFVQSNMP